MDNVPLLKRLTRAGQRRLAADAEKTAADAQVRELILEALHAGESIAEIARRTGYHRNSIRTMKDQAGLPAAHTATSDEEWGHEPHTDAP